MPSGSGRCRSETYTCSTWTAVRGADSPQRASTDRSTPTTRPAFTVAGRAEPVPDTAQWQLADTIRDPEHVVDTEPVARVRP